jgi:tetratricopeptide (TPR) repeat protein
LFARALALCEQQLGPLHPQTAQCLNNLAGAYQEQHEYTKAGPLFLRALAIREQILGPEHLDTAQSLNNLAFLCFQQGYVAYQKKFVQAKALYERALAIYDRQVGPGHPDAQRTRMNYRAVVYALKLVRLARPVLACWQWLLRRFWGATHPRTVRHLEQLALFSHDCGQHERAEQLYRRVLSIRERRPGATHLDTLASLEQLAGFYREQKRYAEAEALYQRALALREQLTGPEHPSTAHCLNNLALLSALQTRKAQAYYRRVLAIREHYPVSHDTAVTLTSLASLCREQGKDAEVETLYRRALALLASRSQRTGILSRQAVWACFMKAGERTRRRRSTCRRSQRVRSAPETGILLRQQAWSNRPGSMRCAGDLRRQSSVISALWRFARGVWEHRMPTPSLACSISPGCVSARAASNSPSFMFLFMHLSILTAFI